VCSAAPRAQARRSRALHCAGERRNTEWCCARRARAPPGTLRGTAQQWFSGTGACPPSSCEMQSHWPRALGDAEAMKGRPDHALHGIFWTDRLASTSASAERSAGRPASSLCGLGTTSSCQPECLPLWGTQLYAPASEPCAAASQCRTSATPEPAGCAGAWQPCGHGVQPAAARVRRQHERPRQGARERGRRRLLHLAAGAPRHA